MVQQLAQGALIKKPPLRRIFLSQCVLLALLSSGMLLIDSVTAYSVLLGGLISICPHAYFARWAFRFSGAREAQSVTHAFYFGETAKFLMTVVMFAGVFAFIKPLNSTALFVAYLFMTAVNWFMFAKFSNNKPGK